VRGAVVHHQVQLLVGVGAGHLLEERRNSWWRCRGWQRAVTVPVAMFNAANNVVVPCRT